MSDKVSIHLHKITVSACLVLGMPAMDALAADHCDRAFPGGKTIVMQGTTIPGIKNRFADTISIEVKTAPANANGIRIMSGTINSSRLPGNGHTWSADDDVIWGNQCLDLYGAEGSDAVFFALSWDPRYHHPNVHGLVRNEGDNWVFRGYLDNAGQQYHEAALTLSWPNAQ